VFLFSGFSKFLGGVGNFVAHLEEQFTGKLPMFMVVPFGYVLPFVETLVGAFLMLGLFNSAALIISGLLLAALTFGLVMAGDVQGVGHNVIYALTNFLLLWMVRYNSYSVDHLLRNRSARW
jgi:thiosulfate dehydrogenase [quinone] large subunit